MQASESPLDLGEGPVDRGEFDGGKTLTPALSQREREAQAGSVRRPFAGLSTPFPAWRACRSK